MTDWINLNDEKPPLDEYVLVWVPSRPWLSQSPTVFAKVARREYWGKDDFRRGEHVWSEFGPGHFDDSEITHWARITAPATV